MAPNRAEAGRADFAEVLRRVATAPGAAPSRRPAAPSGLWPFGERPAGSPLAGRRSYADDAHAPDPEDAGRPAMPEAPLPGIGREDVARELGPLAGLTPAELARLRRRFAAVNHPDNAPPHDHDRATTRMSHANALIDAAIATGRRKR